MKKIPELHVNIDHVATVRQARRTFEPSPLEALKLLEDTNTAGITTHLREDRRHIQDSDIYEIEEYLRAAPEKRANGLDRLSLTFEMAATEEIRTICLKTKAKLATLVPEKREEVTTEGGLDLLSQKDRLTEFIKPIIENGTEISFFVDPIQDQIQAAKDIGAQYVELHTGTYANKFYEDNGNDEVERLKIAAGYAESIGLKVNLGHGLTTANLPALLTACLSTAQIHELHIGHSLISNSIYRGIKVVADEFLDVISASH